ncbi:MAG: hypothetical protein EYC70_16305 [Planctomycetota bacterium]|nr:MAG: hypothetical protein EYC70_16305 [Planctomycetota bacterium]
MAFRAAEYERFSGTRSNAPPWWPLWHATFQRGWASRWIRMITFGGIAIAAIISLILYFVQKVVPEWRAMLEEMGQRVGGEGPSLRFDAEIYLILLHWFVYPVLVPMAMLLGYDLMAGDLRGNALESYFSRPITPLGYLAGRSLAFVSFLLLPTLAPMLWIWCMDVFTAPAGHFAAVRMVPLGLSAALLLISLSLALFIQALTTITRSGLWTALVFVILFILSGGIGPALADLTDQRAFMALAFWDNIFSVANGFLGYPEPARQHAPFALSVSILGGITLLCFLYLLAKVKHRALVG